MDNWPSVNPPGVLIATGCIFCYYFDMEQLYVKTLSPTRAARWDRIFGADRLPVMAAQPRQQETRGGGSVMAYDLDLAQIDLKARNRLAALLSYRLAISYQEALLEINSRISWPLAGDDLYIEKTAVDSRPFWFPGVKPPRIMIYSQ